MDKSKAGWILVIAAAAAAGISYRLIVLNRLEQTSLLFIGIPAIIALICVLTPKPASATGTILKAVTLFIGIAGTFLGEGTICLLMASPLFYIIGVIIGVAIDHAKKNSTMVTCLVFLAMVPMSSEGVHPRTSFNREEAITAEQVIPATPDQVRAALNAPPQLGNKLPFYLRLGFPHPLAFNRTGSSVGDKETIHFGGGEGKPGDLSLEITEFSDHQLRFRALSDTSHVAHWLKWEESTVLWSPVDATHTRVQWTLRYRRLLDPALYFGPWERYAVRLTARQLIQDAATPR